MCVHNFVTFKVIIPSQYLKSKKKIQLSDRNKKIEISIKICKFLRPVQIFQKTRQLRHTRDSYLSNLCRAYQPMINLLYLTGF